MRGLIVAATFLTMSLGLVMAETFNGTIKKKDGNNLTILVTKKKGEEGVEKTFKVDEKVKVSKAGKFDKDAGKAGPAEPLEGGYKNEAVKVDAKGKFVTDDTTGNITEIILGGGGGKKGKKAQ